MNPKLLYIFNKVSLKLISLLTIENKFTINMFQPIFNIWNWEEGKRADFSNKTDWIWATPSSDKSKTIDYFPPAINKNVSNYALSGSLTSVIEFILIITPSPDWSRPFDFSMVNMLIIGNFRWYTRLITICWQPNYLVVVLIIIVVIFVLLS